MATTRSRLGSQAIDDLLRTLPVRVRDKLLRAALTRGAEIVLAEAKALAPVHTGEYRDSLYVRPIKLHSRNASREAAIGVVGGYGLAHLLEYGHAYKATIRGKTYEGNVPAQPHLRTAADNKRDEAVKAISSHLEAHFAEALR